MEVVCQLWLYLKRQVACCNRLVTWYLQLLQHRELQHCVANVPL